MGNEDDSFEKNAGKLQVNFSKALKNYLENPCPPCTKQKARQLLKKFIGRKFTDIFSEDISVYFPAVSEGTMKLRRTVYSHEDAFKHAKELIEGMDVKALAVVVVLIGLIPVYRDHGNHADQLKTLAQHIGQ